MCGSLVSGTTTQPTSFNCEHVLNVIFSLTLLKENAKDIVNQRFSCTQAKADNAAKVKAKKCNKMKLDLNTIQVGFKRREDFNQ